MLAESLGSKSAFGADPHRVFDTARFACPVLAVLLLLTWAFRPCDSVDDRGVGAFSSSRSLDVSVFALLALPKGAAVTARRPSRLAIPARQMLAVSVKWHSSTATHRRCPRSASPHAYTRKPVPVTMSALTTTTAAGFVSRRADTRRGRS